jgi:hypothetical protein
LQDVLGIESATQVSVNFFGDGTCNVGEYFFKHDAMSHFGVLSVFMHLEHLCTGPQGMRLRFKSKDEKGFKDLGLLPVRPRFLVLGVFFPATYGHAHASTFSCTLSLKIFWPVTKGCRFGIWGSGGGHVTESS